MNSSDWRVLASTESTTDENGRYTFTIPPEQLEQRLLYILFDLRHPTYVDRHCGSYGYGMIVKNLSLGAAPWFSKLQMVPGTKILGRLVDGNRKPVTGAQLRAPSTDPSVEGRHGSSSNKSVSDDNGRFEFVVSKNGTAELSIVPIDQCMKHVDVGTKRGDLGDIAPSSGVSIGGRMIDAAGKPIENLWVNVASIDVQEGASTYEMKRSSKSNAKGEFQTRPLLPGKYSVEVETKATGALEKQRYANFHDDPPAAMFVKQIIDVSEESSDKPFIIQAVPHIYISGKFYTSKGKLRDSHSPYLTGRLNDQPVWVREGRRVEKGAFELMIPHGIEDVRLNFSTNEHSALTVQIGDEPPSPAHASLSRRQPADRFGRLTCSRRLFSEQPEAGNGRRLRRFRLTLSRRRRLFSKQLRLRRTDAQFHQTFSMSILIVAFWRG